MWPTLVITDGQETWGVVAKKHSMAQLFLAAVTLSLADAASESSVAVEGGDFTCHATRNGGFLFAADQAHVRVTGGFVSNNVADRKGGAVSGRRWLAVIRNVLDCFALYCIIVT